MAAPILDREQRADRGSHDPAHFVGDLFRDLLHHDGFASFRVEMRILKRGQKEVIVDCGKQYRFVVDFDPNARRRRA